MQNLQITYIDVWFYFLLFRIFCIYTFGYVDAILNPGKYVSAWAYYTQSIIQCETVGHEIKLKDIWQITFL